MKDINLITSQEFNFYWEQGYLIVKNMFDKNEMNIIKNKINKEFCFQNRKKLIINNINNKIWDGGFNSIIVWNKCNGYNIFDKIGKSYKVLDRSSFLYQDDCYCYHNKVTIKYPSVGGFKPHQDYGGYWSKMGIDRDDPHAFFLAIDDCNVSNGCLQIIPKSHKLGNLPHTDVAKDSGIIDNIYHSILNNGYKPQPIILNSGDGVFFHGNTIHLSDDNISLNSRLALIITLNTKRSGTINRACEFKNNHPDYKYHPRIYEKITEEDLNLDFNYDELL